MPGRRQAMKDDDLTFRQVKALEEIADRLARIEELLKKQAIAEGW